MGQFKKGMDCGRRRGGNGREKWVRACFLLWRPLILSGGSNGKMPRSSFSSLFCRDSICFPPPPSLSLSKKPSFTPPLLLLFSPKKKVRSSARLPPMFPRDTPRFPGAVNSKSGHDLLFLPFGFFNAQSFFQSKKGADTHDKAF